MPPTVQHETDEAGERKALLLALVEYERLLEDLAELAGAADRRDAPTISHSQLIKESGHEGIPTR